MRPLFLLHPLKWQMLQVRGEGAPRIVIFYYMSRAPRNLDPALASRLIIYISRIKAGLYFERQSTP